MWTLCEDKTSFRGSLFGRPAYYDPKEGISGRLFFYENWFDGDLDEYESYIWRVRGILDENIPLEDLIVNPATFSFPYAFDYYGEFSGRVSRGEVFLKWERSGATVTGRSGQGDFKT
ncbi:hypothetical protein EC991_002841 [Linnemannia zychae]|nr:hypothetical protein EC991_002841 [Linnemannia zychae]